MGTEERSKLRLIQLEEQRQKELLQKNYHAQKMAQLEAERELKLDLSNITDRDRASALRKLSSAAVRYDKADPNAVPLDGFTPARLSAGQFREQLRRTFGLILSLPELAALVSHFEDESRNMVNSKMFVAHFLKLGSVERDKVRRQVLQQKQKRNEDRVKELADRRVLSAQSYWIQPLEFTEDDEISALDRVASAILKCGVVSVGDQAFSAFRGNETVDAEIFRRELRDRLRLSLSVSQWHALVRHFEVSGTGKIACAAFLGHVKSLLKRPPQPSTMRTRRTKIVTDEIPVATNDPADKDRVSV